MSRGYITLAQNNDDWSYLDQAYALGLSLKATQSTVSNLTVALDKRTHSQLKSKHARVFDHVMLLPWEDDAAEAHWKVNNKWKVYYCSPYDETVLLDSDMIFPTDVSHWWDILSQQDFWATTNAKTFRGDTITSRYYRLVFDANGLPNIYNAFMYFKKSELSSEIFKLAEIIFHNWQRFYHLYLPNNKPKHVSGDVVFALAIKLLGYEHLTTRENIENVPTFVHMKGELQGVNTLLNDWNNQIPSYLAENNNLIVGNFSQQYPFHYAEKNWLTSDIIEQLENTNDRSL